jgi:hypothetical protein
MRLPQCKVRVGVLVAAVAALLGCQHDTPAPATTAPAQSLREIPSPAGAKSGQPNLAVGPAGETYLSWIETTETGNPALKFAVRKDEQWSPAQTIVETEDLVVNYADFPSLLPLAGGVLAAHWMTEIGDTDGYRIDVAFSRDGGHTWSKPVVPHRDKTPTEHGFVSMIPGADGGIGAIWLDSRKLAGAEGSDEVAMMYTNVGLNGKLGPELLIDGRVCECCQPNAVRTTKGILVAYRDRSQDEIRDIAIVRYDGTKWSQPKFVFADNWKINACPINGPAIASLENRVAVAWFTAPNDKPVVKVSFSNDGGETFGQPIQVDDGSPEGRVGVVELDSGGAIVTWLERSDKGVQFRARQVDENGTRHPALVVGSSSGGTSGGFPRVARSGNSAVFAWTDINNHVQVSVVDARK